MSEADLIFQQPWVTRAGQTLVHFLWSKILLRKRSLKICRLFPGPVLFIATLVFLTAESRAQSPPASGSGRETATGRMALVAAPGAQAPSGQGGDLILRSNTRVVEIDVSVHDAHGKPVENLNKNDFTVTDNGKPRPFSIS